MLFSQYLRIERKAGGVSASNRDIIKAIHSMMNYRGAKTREMRVFRHIAIRDALKYKAKSRSILMEGK